MFNTSRQDYCWRKINQEFNMVNLKPTVKHGGGSVFVWGCFSYHGIGNLVFIDSHLTGEKYVNILDNNLLPSARKFGLASSFVFQQDNDPKHTSRVAKAYFDSNKIPVLPWPAMSPDLNPIEHLWDELDRRIPASSRKNKECFKKALLEQWSAISSEIVQNLVKSMPRRLSAVWNAKGQHTKY